MGVVERASARRLLVKAVYLNLDTNNDVSDDVDDDGNGHGVKEGINEDRTIHKTSTKAYKVYLLEDVENPH